MRIDSSMLCLGQTEDPLDDQALSVGIMRKASEKGEELSLNYIYSLKSLNYAYSLKKWRDKE